MKRSYEKCSNNGTLDGTDKVWGSIHTEHEGFTSLRTIAVHLKAHEDELDYLK